MEDEETDIEMEEDEVTDNRQRVMLEGLLREDDGRVSANLPTEEILNSSNNSVEIIEDNEEAGITNEPNQPNVMGAETDSVANDVDHHIESSEIQQTPSQGHLIDGAILEDPSVNRNSNNKDHVLDTEQDNAEGENKAANVSIDDDDGQTCSICLETWTISGEHRLCSLKCGHLFGNSCIVRWLKQTSVQCRACPSCKSKVSLKDIRFIYARKVITADTTQEEFFKQQLAVAKTENARLEAELTAMTTSHRMFAIKIAELQKEICSLKDRSNEINTQRKMKSWRYTMHCNTEICKNNSCRVLVYNNRNNSLYVSLMSTNNLFPGYAMRKVTCDTWTVNKLLYLHPKAIRDASYSASNDLLMTVGLDKSVKLVQGANDMIAITIQSPMPLWSCCWDATNTNRLWVGGVGGVVCEYDLRQSRTAMSHINATDVSPVASLASLSGGFIACRLNTVSSYRKMGDSIHSVQLPIDGSFTCVRSDLTSNDLLISCRSSSNHPRSRHIYCKSDIENFEFTPYVTFEGSLNSPIMSRSILYSIDDQMYVSAYNGDDSTVCTWSVASGNRSNSLGANDYVVDMVPITNGSGNLAHLATLSQSRLRIHQVTPTEMSS